MLLSIAIELSAVCAQAFAEILILDIRPSKSREVDALWGV
jgi:hypothetical protein